MGPCVQLAATVTALAVCFQAVTQVPAVPAGQFYAEYIAPLDAKTNNSPDRIRANDPEISLHPKLAAHPAAGANGLLLVNVDEDLSQIDRAELYLELWGGHPGTANKRFFLNGKGPYAIPEVGTADKHCTYSYPTIPLIVSHLVPGLNSIQFTCDKGSSFWGHFIIDYAAVRCYLKPEHPAITETGLTNFNANITTGRDGGGRGAKEPLCITCDPKFADRILSVDYLAKYQGFDDNGDGIDVDFHGFTQKGKYINHLGSSSEAPQFAVELSGLIVPDAENVMLKAIVRLKGGLSYIAESTDPRRLRLQCRQVRIFKCSSIPAPFWSRAGKEVKAQINLPDNIAEANRVRLMIKVWDGGEGSIKHPFKINGHPYKITSGKACHNVVFTVADIDIAHLKPGENEITLLSDTEHHGIEVLLPGPVILACWP